MGYQHRVRSQIAPTGLTPGQVVYTPQEHPEKPGHWYLRVAQYVRETKHRVYLRRLDRRGKRISDESDELKPVRLFSDPLDAIAWIRRHLQRDADLARETVSDREQDIARLDDHQVEIIQDAQRWAEHFNED